MRIALAAAAVVLCAPALAHADQCAINDKTIADRAVELAKKSNKLLELCEPCGEKLPQGPYAIGSVSAANGRVTFDGRMLDLAYVYIHVGGTKYVNLGIAAGCTVEQVSQTLHSSHALVSRPAAPPPPPPRPPRPPGYASRTRVSQPDDLAGTWSISVRPNMTTCPNPVTNHSETWTITVTNGDIVVNQGTGADDFLGTQGALQQGMYKSQLATLKRPSANALHITQSLKDVFWGKIARAESSGRRSDPACLTVVDVSATRVPNTTTTTTSSPPPAPPPPRKPAPAKPGDIRELIEL